MVGLEILTRVTSEKRQEFLQSVTVWLRVQGFPGGCINRALFEDVRMPNHFLWVEHWTSRDMLMDYCQSERCRTLLGAIEVLGMLEDLRIVEWVTSLEGPPGHRSGR